jgi:hypothetical protein
MYYQTSAKNLINLIDITNVLISNYKISLNGKENILGLIKIPKI